MRAAIYARKSSVENVQDEHTSCARQIAHARDFAASKGWQVLDEFVFEDAAISGAEFQRRPGFLRLMNALTPAPFDVLIMSEESRLGREAIETAYALKQIITAGVRVFFYLEDRERTLQGPTDKLLMSVAAFADELERERARQRTHDALARKAKAGHVTGGRVFGYDNIEIIDGQGRRSHVERRINDQHVPVILRIFELAANGMGMRSIALTLNEDCALAPQAQRGRPSAWCPSSVFEALRRDLYRGLITWNRSQKRDSWGRTKHSARQPADWIESRAEHLRIVPEELWQRAHAALERRRSAYLSTTNGQPHGRPAVGKPSKYMLTGFVECGQCHGSLVVRTNRRGKHARVPGLACWHYMTRGPRACTNRTLAPLDGVTDRVLDKIAAELLAPAVVDMAITFAVELLREADGDQGDGVARATDMITALDAEAGRLAELVGAGVGDLPPIVTRLQAIKTQRAALARLVERPRLLMPDTSIEDAVHARVARWRDVLQRRAPETKVILEGLLDGRIVVAPQEDGQSFVVRIPLKTTGLLEGVLSPKALASPPGDERVRFDVTLVFRPKAA